VPAAREVGKSGRVWEGPGPPSSGHQGGEGGGGQGEESAAHHVVNGVGLEVEEVHATAPARVYNKNAGTAEREHVELRLAPPRPSRAFRVKRLIKGTAADRSQAPFLSTGDELVRVNNMPVDDWPLARLLAELKGVPGTSVTVTLRRSLSQAARPESAEVGGAEAGVGDLDGAADAASDASSDLDADLDLWSYYQVTLVRGSAEYMAMLDVSNALLAERDQLASRVAELEADRAAGQKQVLQLRQELDVSEKVNSDPYTLHPTPYTLHPTPYTLHPNPKPQTLGTRRTLTPAP